MEQLLKRRKAAKVWLARICDKLEDCNTGDSTALETLLVDFDNRLQNLDNVQLEIEDIIEENELENDINEMDVFRCNCLKSKLKAVELLNSINTTTHDSNENISNCQVSVTATPKTVNLPKLELKDFNGDPLLWQPFWEQFKVVIDEAELPEVTKFTYRKSLLKGEAKASIEGLTLIASNYQVGLEILKKRYGRKEKIVFCHLQSLLSIKELTNHSVGELRGLQDLLLSHVRALEAMGIDGKDYGVIMTPLILSKLPTNIRLEWARDDSEGKESDLKCLLEFLDKEINRKERSESCIINTCTPGGGDNQEKRSSNQEKRPSFNKRRPTAGIFPIQQSCNCLICHTSKHPPWRCSKLLGMSPEDRRRMIKDCGLCFCCFSNEHLVKDCSIVCKKCGGKHNTLLCITNRDRNHYSSQNTNSHVGTVTDIVEPSHNTTVLQMARATVVGKRQVIANIMFDSGSDRTYISNEFVKRLKPEYVCSQEICYTAFGNSFGKKMFCNVHKIDISCMFNRKNQQITAIAVPQISAPMFRKAIPTKYLKDLEGLPLSEDYVADRKLQIDILVGQDYYWSFFLKGRIPLSENLVAQETLLGWVISGSCQNSIESSTFNVQMCHQLLSINGSNDDQDMKNFWDLESIGISPQIDEFGDPVLNEFNKSVKLVEGRYEVSLPWKKHFGPEKLVNNEKLAQKRLTNLTKKLNKNPDLQKAYNQTLSEMEQNDIIVEVSENETSNNNPVFYLPHRPVVKESSLTTKVRPVFDASATGYNGVSLNDCLLTGPNLLPSLPQILIRFRRWPIALTADITKAFLQLRVRREDQDVHRFLWDVNDTTKVMRFVRLPFGNKSSPFLLNGTIKHHLLHYRQYFPDREITPSTAMALDELSCNLYVDDWLSGADYEEEAEKLFNEAFTIMMDANLPLAKIGTNNPNLCKKMSLEYDKKFLNLSCHKILGLHWLSTEDCFVFENFTIPVDLVITKRVVLSFIARFYDPLGFVNPYLVTAKLIFQDVWRLGLDWEVELPDTLNSQFKQWLLELESVQYFKVPRCFSMSPWKELQKLEVHGFGDASKKCYGTAVYIKCYKRDGSVSTSLVMSKAKIAPLKEVSLPRLELLGALLTARLVSFVMESLQITVDVKLFCWTDSMIALSWIKGQNSRWKPFVANRVNEIQQITDVKVWNHCPGVQNPSDLLTRGLSIQSLLKSDLWLKGPEWLIKSDCYPKAENFEPLDLSCVPETKTSTLLCTLDTDQSLIPFHHWGSFTKCLRIFAWILRFKNNIGGENARFVGDLSCEEISLSETALLKYIQSDFYPDEITTLKKGNKTVDRSSSIHKLSPFLDEQGFLRVRGRLEYSELTFEQKHPIILPRCHVIKLLILFEHNLQKHAGVQTLVTYLRCKYWIIGCRRLVKDVVRKCIFCRLQDSRPCNASAAQISSFRATQAPPFSVVGVDHAGPLFCADFFGKKFYICLFTCAVIRAVHLELAESLSTSDFLLCFKRFVSRRGVPSVVYSDNSRTFKASSRELQKYYGPNKFQWKFILPISPWWGGWWERLIRSVKVALKKSIKKQSLTRKELETTLIEIESTINSRPITFCGDELDSSTPLTPNICLLGRSTGQSFDIIEDPQNITTHNLLVRERVKETILTNFWNSWRHEYLTSLPLEINKFKNYKSLSPGSFVLIREDNVPRFKWPLGVVKSLHKGRDGVVRGVELNSSKGVISRPIQRIHPLEISEFNE